MLLRFAILVVALATVGCGASSSFPKTYPVTGSVKLNGKPINGAMVTFQLQDGKENAIGTTDATGGFSLSMFRPNDGAIPGQYRVAVTKLPEVPPAQTASPPGQIASGDLPDDYAPPVVAAKPAAGAGPKSEIPAKFSNDETSGLRATVSESGPNHFDFDLK